VDFTGGARLEVRITPADVGRRVSVRSRTTPGSASAAFTDTVGVLTSWTAGVVRVTRRDGSTAELRESDLVAGKVVPAAPARRRGMPSVGARELERVAARGWPPLESERLGDWTLRASPVVPPGPGGPREGFTTRANSVLPHGAPGLPLDDALARVTAWYAARGLVARIQVTTGDADGDEMLGAELDRRGWTAERHAVLRVGPLAPLADRAPDPRVRTAREPDDGWLRAYGRAERPGPAARAVLTGGPSVWFARVPGEGATPAAIGRCVVDGRWAGFAAVEVAPDHRRQGLATAVMAELARAALAEGASAAYLQVETGNAGARALYDGLGFADHHAYHYRRAPAG
jgi:GNAT superfamily N-acetyltransferase